MSNDFGRPSFSDLLVPAEAIHNAVLPNSKDKIIAIATLLLM